MAPGATASSENQEKDDVTTVNERMAQVDNVIVPDDLSAAAIAEATDRLQKFLTTTLSRHTYDSEEMQNFAFDLLRILDTSNN